MTTLHHYSDAVKCRVFVITLVGAAQKWFQLLRPGSLTCFDNLYDVFLKHFASCKKYQQTIFCLFNVKQEPIEPLRKYIQRFTQTALKVPTAALEVLMAAISQGLRDGAFFLSLIKKPPRGYDELLGRVEKYINVEEAQKA